MRAEFVLEPGKNARIRAEVPGAIRQVLVRQGDEVKTGQFLAILGNPEIEKDAQVLTQQLALADSETRNMQGRPETNRAAAATGERERLQKLLAVARKKVEALEIRAVLDGVVKTPQVEQRSGQFLAAGDEFCQIVNRGNMKARILVSDSDLELVRPGATP